MSGVDYPNRGRWSRSAHDRDETAAGSWQQLHEGPDFGNAFDWGRKKTSTAKPKRARRRQRLAARGRALAHRAGKGILALVVAVLVVGAVAGLLRVPAIAAKTEKARTEIADFMDRLPVTMGVLPTPGEIEEAYRARWVDLARHSGELVWFQVRRLEWKIGGVVVAAVSYAVRLGGTMTPTEFRRTLMLYKTAGRWLVSSVLVNG